MVMNCARKACCAWAIRCCNAWIWITNTPTCAGFPPEASSMPSCRISATSCKGDVSSAPAGTFVVCSCCSICSMFSFDRSGAGVTGTGLGTGFCAYTRSQIARRMASKAKANPVFFMVADLLEARACCAFIYPDTAATSLVRIYSVRGRDGAGRKRCPSAGRERTGERLPDVRRGTIFCRRMVVGRDDAKGDDYYSPRCRDGAGVQIRGAGGKAQNGSFVEPVDAGARYRGICLACRSARRSRSKGEGPGAYSRDARFPAEGRIVALRL